MTVQRGTPQMSRAIFENWTQASVARIASDASFIMVNGLVYQKFADPGSLALPTTGDGAAWAPPLHDPYILHFYTETTTDQQAIERAFAWAAAVADRNTIKTTPNRNFGLPITLNGAGKLWEMTAKVPLVNSHAKLKLVGLTAIATGNSWAYGDPYGDWTFRSHTGMTAEQVEAATRIQFYRPWYSDCMFEAGAGASNVVFEDCFLDCNQRAGGIALAAYNSAVRVNLTGVAGYGFKGVGGGASLSGCRAQQWQIAQDPQYYDKDAYTGVMVFTEDTDFRVRDSSFQWAYELARFEGTNNKMWDCYGGNGSQGYNAVDRVLSAEMNQAIFDYFKGKGDSQASGWTTAADVASHNFTPRAVHIGITTAARKTKAEYEAAVDGTPQANLKAARMDVVIQDPYFDNCVHRLFTKRVTFFHYAFGSKKTSSLSSGVTAIFEWYAPNTSSRPQGAVIFAIPMVESTNNNPTDEQVEKHYSQYLPGLFGGTWVGDWTAFNADESINWISSIDTRDDYGYAWTALALNAVVNLNATSGNPSEIYHDIGQGSFVGYTDANTTPGSRVDAGGKGNHYAIRFPTGGTLDVPLPSYADNAAALSGGLTAGLWYKVTSSGAVMQVI